GEPLFKRGWRTAQAEAPLRENLAAGIVMLSGWRPDEPLLDPMCGGATLLVEAAAMARGRAPGARRAFGFEKLALFDSALWEKLKREAQGSSSEADLGLYGSDTDPRALAAARRNLAAAGVERWVQLEQADVLERSAPALAGVMVMNPPYGERMGSEEELARFYPKLGDALKNKFAGWRCYVFTADLRLPKLIRLEPSARTPLWNGALECRLYEFEMVAGSRRRKPGCGPSLRRWPESLPHDAQSAAWPRHDAEPSALVRWNDTRVAGAAREPLGRHRIAFKDKSAVSLCVALGSAQERSHEAGAPQVPGDEMAGNAPPPGGAVHRLQAARSGKAGIRRAGRDGTPPDGNAFAVRDEPRLGARAHPTAQFRLPLRGL